MKEVYIAVDVEADGPIPGEFSMLSIGLATVGDLNCNFYTEIKPISNKWITEAMDVNGLDRDKLKITGIDPQTAMLDIANWLKTFRKVRKLTPIALFAPAVWDGMFVHWYFIKYLGYNPFGVTGSGVDLRSYWMGVRGCLWRESHKKSMRRIINFKPLKHTHNALDDAKELAVYYENILEFNNVLR